MALKFLNKKGWHTGSLRNIENVWKAEQKHDAEQKKLEELRKQIQDERERSEFRLLQEQAGLVPKQERLEFLYDSGLSVGKTSDAGSSGGSGVAFKALEEASPAAGSGSGSGAGKQAAGVVPGALFEEKPQSANDAWRKLHSDPLLLIRQREQEALARIKNNPVQMDLIRKSVEGKNDKERSSDKKKHSKKHTNSDRKHHKHSPSELQSDSEKVGVKGEKRRKTGNRDGKKYDEHYDKRWVNSDGESSDREKPRRKNDYRGSSRYRERSPSGLSGPTTRKDDRHDTKRKNHDNPRNRKHSPDGRVNCLSDIKEREKGRNYPEARCYDSSASAVHHDSYHKRRNTAPKLSEQERAARLREMQADAELHEEQRWKRLKRVEEDDAREAARTYGGRNFLDSAQKSVYGAEKGGSSTIEESVRRRAYYSQGRSEVGDGNAFRR